MIEVIGGRLNQYDLDRQVGIMLRPDYRLEAVRFWKSEAADPLTVAFSEYDGYIVANIPNILLTSHGTLTVELAMRDMDGIYAAEKATFTVHKATRPDDYQYTETETMGLCAGGSGGTLFVSVDAGEETYSPSFAEIEQAYFSGQRIIVQRNGDSSHIMTIDEFSSNGTDSYFVAKVIDTFHNQLKTAKLYYDGYVELADYDISLSAGK